MPDPTDASAKQVRQEWDKNSKSATGVQQECDISATKVLHEPLECDTSEKVWLFDNDTSENLFSHPYISYIAI